MSSGRNTSPRPSPEKNNSSANKSPQIKMRQALVASFKKKQPSRKKTEDKSPMRREESSSSSSAEEESPVEFVNQINSNFKFKKRRPSIFINKQFGSIDMLKRGAENLLGIAQKRLADEAAAKQGKEKEAPLSKWYTNSNHPEPINKPKPKIMREKTPS